MYNITNKSDAVKEIKRLLFGVSQKLYPSIPRTTIDGIYDEETRKAISAFQAINGLNSSGETDLATFTALYDDFKAVENEFYGRDYIISADGFPLCRGDMSEDVRALHIIINELAKTYRELENVGTGSYYSRKTQRAVSYLQRIFMLEESGELDRHLYERMLKEIDSVRRSDKKPTNVI